MQSYPSHFCGGSIISENWAISAAHCLSGSSTSKTTLRICSEKFANGGTIVKVKRIVVHEDYNPRTIEFDCSLLELNEPLIFSDKIQPIELPTTDDVLPDGSNCLISSWGNTMNCNECRAILRGFQFSEEGPNKLIGVVSSGIGCAQANYPGVYSRVQAAHCLDSSSYSCLIDIEWTPCYFSPNFNVNIFLYLYKILSRKLDR